MQYRQLENKEYIRDGDEFSSFRGWLPVPHEVIGTQFCAGLHPTTRRPLPCEPEKPANAPCEACAVKDQRILELSELVTEMADALVEVLDSWRYGESITEGKTVYDMARAVVEKVAEVKHA